MTTVDDNSPFETNPAHPSAAGAPAQIPIDPGTPSATAVIRARQARLAREGGLPFVKREVPAQGMCVMHPAVPAARMCHRCRAPMCETCDFVFPDGMHVCPECVSNPSVPVSPARRRYAWYSIASTLVCFVSLALIISHVLVLAPEMAGIWGTFLIIGPVLLGLALSLMSRSRRLGNSTLILFGSYFNLMMCVIVALLIVFGLSRR